jgi:hypothetical protein
MAEKPPARSREQRKRDALRRLEQDVDAWVATADLDTGAPYLTPLSFLWNGSSLLLATAASSPTGRNLAATGTARIGIGETRDVLLVEGTVQPLEAADLAPGEGDAFAEKTGFDPRELPGHLYFRVSPGRLTAWREANELRDRDLITDGRWTVG